MSGIVFNTGGCMWDNPIVYFNSPPQPELKTTPLPANKQISQKGKLGRRRITSFTFEDPEKGLQSPSHTLDNSNISESSNKHFQLISPNVALQAHFSSNEIVGIFSGLNCYYINDALRKQLGYKPEEWLGKSILPYVYPQDQKHLEEFFEKFVIPYFQNQDIPFCRIKLQPKQTSKPLVNVELNFFNFDAIAVNPVLRGVTFRNIDVQVAQEERAKKLGHELANTLSTAEQLFQLIMGEFETLDQDPNFDLKKFENIKKMFDLGAAQVHSASQRCKYEVRTGQSGRFEIKNRTTDLFKKLSKFAEINFEINRGGDVQFVSLIDSKLENVFVNFDFSFFQPILENTIKNSLRAVLAQQRDIKSVSLSLQVVKDYGDALDLHFTIQDTGTGFGSSFTKKKYSEVFNKEDRPKIIDNGYGLKHSADKIEALGSELYISSDPLKGSTLEFTLRVMKKQMDLFTYSRLSSAAVSSNTQASEGMFKILIVDDNSLNRTLLSRRMKNYNVCCSNAENGKAAVLASRTTKFDIIFMDFEMPVLNGLDASKQIRSDELSLNKQTQIWGLTGNQSDEDFADGIAAGMNEVLVKPASIYKISECITQHFPNQLFIESLTPSPKPRKASLVETTEIKIEI